MKWKKDFVLRACLTLSLCLAAAASGLADDKQAEEKNWQEKDRVLHVKNVEIDLQAGETAPLYGIEKTIQQSRELTVWGDMAGKNQNDQGQILIVNGEQTENGKDTAAIEKPENYKDPSYYKQIVMIGDSRTVGLSQVCEAPQGVTVIWSCKGAMGYDWMRETGAPQMEPYLAEDTAIVILMGVNDVHHINEYLAYVNEKSLDWATKGADTYFCTVGPLTTESLYVTNPEVIMFNEALHQGLNSNVKIIELYDHMMNSGFSTFDGIHYSISTDHDMFQYILACLVNEHGRVPGSIW